MRYRSAMDTVAQGNPPTRPPASLARFAWLSVLAAIATILLKGVAWWITGSVGLLSDALESFVNLAGALMALWMLALAARPADADHAYGHGKAEYFSSGFEGGLILIAAASIAWAAIDRLMHPQPLERISLGLGVSVVAALVNLATSFVLMRAARQHGSVTLRASAHHLMTDVWTSAGVLVAVGLVALTGWLWLDPVVALAVAANIVRTGSRIVMESIDGLMDRALPEAELALLRGVLDRYTGPHVRYHALRTRQSGRRRFVSVHVLVPGTWSVGEGHRLLEHLEADLRAALPNTTVFTHLEPLGDPAAMNDLDLDR
jgi:cation diffusion facilitator family transporter